MLGVAIMVVVLVPCAVLAAVVYLGDRLIGKFLSARSQPHVQLELDI